MNRLMQKAGWFTASAAMALIVGCGDSGTNVTLAEVPPVTSAPEKPKPLRKAKSASPAILPGSQP